MNERTQGHDHDRLLGRRLREERVARRLSLGALAESSGLTKGYLSKLEREQATPSVATLLRLCHALGLSIGELFEEHAGSLVRSGHYPRIPFGGEGMRESLLTPTLEQRLQVIHSQISPGGGSGKERYSLPADVEMVFVLSGQLDINLEDQAFHLSTGDALTFSPGVDHSFQNPHSEEEAHVLWILTPGLPGNASRDAHNRRDQNGHR